MRCPRCGAAGFVLSPCPACGFTGEAGLLETLAHVDYLLAEIHTWTNLLVHDREELTQRYSRRRREIEVALGLRQPPLDAAAAAAAHLQVLQLDALAAVIPSLISQGWVSAAAGQELRSETESRIDSIRQRLVDAPATADPSPKQRFVAEAQFVLQAFEQLYSSGRAVAETYPRARASLAATLERAEIAAGVRRAPAPTPPPRPAAPERPKAPPSPPRPPRQPLTWDRVWETLLSERTLRAILFLGAALLFFAAVSLVVWNWGTFAPWLQVTFLALFTAAFYGLGWYVRAHLCLRASGMALSAVASLLVPLDFYAFYLSGGFPRDRWPEVWLLASAVCLVAYLATTYLLQSELFGYLVGVASGSLLCAALRVSGVDLRWWQAALAGLALALALAGEGLHRARGRWRLLAAPLWRVALAATVTILPVALGWGFVRQAGDRTFAAALAVAWWIGGATSVLAARRYRLPMFSGIAAGISPVSLWLTQRVLFERWGVGPAWHALGWGLLVPAYLVAGRLLQRHQDEVWCISGRVVTVGAAALTLLAAGWAVTDWTAAGFVHLLLAGSVGLAVYLWRRPWLAPLASLFLLSTAAALMAGRGATVAQVGLAWALLAILHVAAGLGLRRLAPARGDKVSPAPLPHPSPVPPAGEEAGGLGAETGGAAAVLAPTRPRRSWPQLYDAPPFLAAWLISALAVVPPLVMLQRPILACTVGGCVTVSGWLALLAARQGAPGLSALLNLWRWPQTLFQWVAALVLLPWAWTLWIAVRPVEARLGLVYVGVAGVLLALGCWLRRYRWTYGWPWFYASHAAIVVALATALVYYDPEWLALALLLTAAFYFAAAWLLHGRWWLAAGAVVLTCGWLLGLDWLGVAHDPLGLLLALLVLACLVGAALLERYGGLHRRFLLPFYGVVQGIGVAAAATELALAILSGQDRAALLWAAGGLALLVAGSALCAWLFARQEHGHIAAWLGLVTGTLLALAYSQLRGSSAVRVAVMAAAYVLAERALHWVSLRQGLAGRLPPGGWLDGVRRAWQLYRRPLLVAGWSAAVGAIFLALVQNLALLGGGWPREMWAIVTLLLVVALLALSAHLFGQRRFVWFAAALVVLPWTLLTHQGWYIWEPPAIDYASLWRYCLSWVVLAVLELLLGLFLAARLGPRRPFAPAEPPRPCGPRARWGWPTQVVGHLLAPLALLLSLSDIRTALLPLGLGIVFYLVATWADRWQEPAPAALWRGRFLYPAAVLVPFWALYLLTRLVPDSTLTMNGLLLLAFAPPALVFGRLLARRERAYGLPLYLLSYVTALVGTLLVSEQRPVLIGALLLDTVLAAASAWTFRAGVWIFPASPPLAGALVLALAEWGVPFERYGWGLLALAGVYLLVAQLLRRPPRPLAERRELLARYVAPLLVCAALLGVAGLVCSSFDSLGALVGYGAATGLYVLAAILLRRPFLLTPATILAAVAYGAGLRELGVARADHGLALWPGVAAALLLAYAVDWKWGRLAELAGEMVPRWPALQPFLQQVGRWWALPLYVAGYAGAALSALLSLRDPGRLALTLLGAALAYGLATWRFRRRLWLLVAVGTAQLAALAAARWLGWADTPAAAALTFAPVTWVTALAGLAVAWLLREGAPLGPARQGWRVGWSRPLYLLLLADVVVGQLVVLNLSWWKNGWVSLSHALLLGLLATLWSVPLLGYGATFLGLAALVQRLGWLQPDVLFWSWPLALLTIGYGLAGYLVRYLRQRGRGLPKWVLAWEAPLCWSGWLLSGATLLLTGGNAIASVGITTGVVLRRVQTVVSGLALVGLLYLAAAVTDRRRWLGYIATAMLLSAWSLQWFLVWGWREVQWYAVPAGIYLLAIGYLEWTHGRRPWARWIDWAGLLLLLGTSFRQSLGERGWPYALVMGVEGLLIFWWGSARRTRRFLYAGVGAVLVDVVAQLINQLAWVSPWIVFAVVGAFLLALAIAVERRLGWVKELRGRLEHWD